MALLPSRKPRPCIQPSVGAGYTASISAGGGFKVTGVGPAIPIRDQSGTPLPEFSADDGNGGFVGGPVGDGQDTIKVAAGGSPQAGLGIMVDLNGAGAAAPADPRSEGGDWMLTVIGVIIGIGLGTMALLLRRVLS